MTQTPAQTAPQMPAQTAVKLADYQPYSHVLDRVALTFRLLPQATRVQARLHLAPNPVRGSGLDLRLDDGGLGPRHVGADEGWREEAAGDVLQGLPPAGVLDRAPRGDRPAIVELPIQSSHATRSIQTMSRYCTRNGVTLRQLGEINKLFKILAFSVQ